MPKVKVTRNGPYQVEQGGAATQQFIITNEQGQSWEYQAGKAFPLDSKAFLCRCGHSHNAPFCDGSHAQAGMDLTEHASRRPLIEGAEEFDGPEQILTDNESYCAFARFCDAGERVWGEVALPGAEHATLTQHMAHRCPGGRLQLWRREDGTLIEPERAPSINLIEDPAMGCSGPIMLLGGIEVVGADGESYEIRDRQALCRCGRSSNKPFCDGSHASIKYQDRIAE